MNEHSFIITIYVCINFDFIGNDLIKNCVAMVLTWSVFSSEWRNTTSCMKAALGISQ